MLPVVRNKWIAGALTGGLVAASTLMIAGPASAAPGDASAFAAEGALTIDVADLDVDVDTLVGAVSASNPGSAADEGKETKYFKSLPAVLTSGSFTTTADSTAEGSSASAKLENAHFTVLGYNVITFTSAEANVSCPVDGESTAEASLGALTLLDRARTLSVELPTAEETVALEGDLLGATLTVRVEQVATTEGAATATALDVDLLINGIVDGAPVVDLLIGSMTLASATCEAPTAPVVPLTATAIDPASGPTAGGQTATITGTGFGADTTVTFDGNPAVVNGFSEDGTTLTVTTPAGDAGAAEVKVSNPTGSAVLAYEYVAPPVVTPTAPVTHPVGTTTGTLAKTGADSTLAPVFAGAFLLLAGSAALAIARRRLNA